MVLHPIAEFVAGGERITVQQDPAFSRERIFIPFEEAAADDFGGLGFRRHDHGLANAVEQLFEAIVVGLVVGTHFELGRRNRYGETMLSRPRASSLRLCRKL